MKKLLATVAIATTALLAAAATASADITFDKPSCQVQGIATFEKHLTGTQAPNRYDFVSGDPNGGGAQDQSKCSGTLNGVAIENQLVQVRVGGAGNLSCAQSASTGEGPGTVLFLSSGVIVPFTLSFTAVATEVDLTVKGTKSGQGDGSASFAKYAPPGAPLECEGLNDVDGDGQMGLKKLGFEATFSSTGALVAPSPATSGGGAGGGSGSGGGGVSGGGSTGALPGTVQSVVTLRAATQKLKDALKKGIAATLRGNVPAKATLKAQLDAATARRYGIARSSASRPVTIGKGTIALTRAGSKKGYVKLSSAAKRKLRNARRVKVKLVGTILDVTQRRQSVSKTVLLK